MRTLIFFLFFSLGSSLAMGSPLDDARDSGQIVELPSGYVQATASAPASIKALADDVNSKRKAAYEKIAKKNGITVEQVAAESYRKRVGG